MEKSWKILIVDDKQSFINQVTNYLSDFAHRNKILAPPLCATEPGAASFLLKENPDIALVLLDIVMTERDSGLKLVTYARDTLRYRNMQIILMTGESFNDEEKIIEKYQVNGYIRKAHIGEGESFETTVKTKLDTYDHLLKNEQLAERYKEELKQFKTSLRCEAEYIMGKGNAIGRVLNEVEKIADCDFPILFEGETGTGKEEIVRYMHKISKRKNQKFFPVNCATIKIELAESILFGHEKGAFTGADSTRIGLLENTGNGMILLDEINSLPFEIQGKLLRTLQENTIVRMGGTEEIKINVRIIGAGNKPFGILVEQGAFREDLFERFVRIIRIPSLRERSEDINHLIDRFLAEETEKMGKKVLISAEAREILLCHKWKRNARQLMNVITNLIIDVEQNQNAEYIIRPAHVFHYLKEADNGQILENMLSSVKDYSLETALNKTKKEALLRALKETNGSDKKAIELLQIDKNTYYSYKRIFNIRWDTETNNAI